MRPDEGAADAEVAESAADHGSIGEETKPWILLGLALFGVGIASWYPVPTGIWHDDGAYMLIAKALAGGYSFTYEGVVGAPPATKFPPLYPITLAGIWTLTRSIGPATLVSTILNIGLLATAGALFGRFLYRSANLPLGLSLAVAAMGFASADVVRTALLALSEPLFILLVVLALIQWPRVSEAMERLGGPPPADDARAARSVWSTLALPALILIAVVATRSAGLALVLAFAAAILVSQSRLSRLAAAAFVTGPALLFIGVWDRWSAIQTTQIPEGARDLLGPYRGWLADQALSVPATFLGELPSHTVGVLGSAIALLVPGLTGAPLWTTGGILLVVAGLGTVILIRRLPPLGWFVPGYLAMLLLWPYLDRRLLVPLHPMLVTAIAVGGLALIQRLPGEAVRKTAVALAAIWMLGFGAVTTYRIADGWPTAPYRLRAVNLAATVEAMTKTVPDDAVVGAPEFWAALHLHGGWTVAPSVRFDPRSIDPEAPIWGTPDEQLALWSDSGIDHLLLEQGGQLHGAALDQLEEECPGSVLVLARMRPAMVVKLDWAASCRPTPPSTTRSP